MANKRYKGQPVYRVLKPIILSTTGQEKAPGAIVDLSHLPPDSLKWFLDNGFFETADGEPENEPAEPVEPCVGCQ